MLKKICFKIMTFLLVSSFLIISCSYQDFTEIKKSPEFYINDENSSCGTDTFNVADFFKTRITVYWNTVTGANYYEIRLNNESLKDENNKILQYSQEDSKNGITLEINKQLKYDTVYEPKN